MRIIESQEHTPEHTWTGGTHQAETSNLLHVCAVKAVKAGEHDFYIQMNVRYIQAKQVHTMLIKPKSLCILLYTGVFKSGVCGDIPVLAPR